MDKDLSKVISSWDRHHQSVIFLDRKKDKLGLDIVCVPGYPLAYNNMLHFFQMRAHNKLEETLKAMGGKIEGMNVLDLGCGTGRWCEHFHKRGAAAVTGIDISQVRLDDNKARLSHITFKKMPVTKLDFSDNTFDIINISWVLQHNNAHLQEQAISEMCRVLKKGGFIFFMEGAHEKKFPIPKHSFPRTTGEWIELFEKNDATIIHNQKILETFLTDFYVKWRNKAVNYIRPKLGLSLEYTLQESAENNTEKSTESNTRQNRKQNTKQNVYDFLENKDAQKKRKFRLLRNTHRLLDQGVLSLLSYASYPIELTNAVTFKHFPEGTLTLLIQKK
jgi:ubiquinone/menaquinone biosynthesis C-methylase UbiE